MQYAAPDLSATEIIWYKEHTVTNKMPIARQWLVKDDCWAMLGKQCLKAGKLKSIA
jgi:hypothetical protein